MKCLSEEMMQEYIDGEVNKSHKIEIESHLKTCKSCNLNFLRQNEISKSILSSLNSLSLKNDTIPNFRTSENTINSNPKNRIYLRYVSIVAAACVLMFVFFIPWSENNPLPKSTIIVYDFTNDIDANLPLSSQALSFHVYSSDGSTAKIINQ